MKTLWLSWGITLEVPLYQQTTHIITMVENISASDRHYQPTSNQTFWLNVNDSVK